MPDNLLLFLSGIAGGLIAGFLGGGGGIIYILILPVALHDIAGINETELATFTVANSIFGIMFTTLFGNIAHLRLKTFYLRETLIVGLSGAILSVLIIRYFVNTPYYSPIVFNVIIVLLLSFAVIQGIYDLKIRKSVEEKENGNKKLAVSGMLAGSFSALSGLGGGIVLIPVLKYWLKMDIKKAKSISLGMIFLSSFAMSVFNLIAKPVYEYPGSTGLIVFSVNIPIILGVLIASPLGVGISHRVRSQNINIVFLIFMTIVLIKKIFELING